MKRLVKRFIVFCSVCILLVSFPVSAGALDDSGDLTQYVSGMYKVGVDIPAGEYVVFADGGKGYFCVSSDSNQNDILFNDNFDYNSIITISDGEYVKLNRCYAVPISEEPEVDTSGTGMFLIGNHLPAGEYKLDSGSDKGYYCIYSSSRQDEIVANDNFQGQNYVTVSDGQYLVLSRCSIADAPGAQNDETADADEGASIEAGASVKYDSGVYKVGEDIPAGEYVVFADDSGKGYFSVSSDSNQSDILFNDNFAYNSIITINDGEYLDLSRCYAVPISEDPDVDVTGSGMFLVGKHIPAGEYQLDSGSEKGYYCIYSDSRQDDIMANDIFEGTDYVSVTDGQYLVLSRCAFTNPPEKPVKTYTDAETVKSVQEALNAAGYDCGTPDGIAGSGTTSAIEKYQTDNNLSVTGTITDELLNSLGV